ncbi:MAG: hypothetical protein QOH81_969 [Sphingomonadales bacterium]|nr:hypothetical protein [Sphingomonadales bacterium]
MPKPWEIDWSSGPQPEQDMPPIVPFFGRQLPPMLDSGGSAIGPSAMPSAGSSPMLSPDPLAVPSPNPFQALVANPQAVEAPDPSAGAAADRFARWPQPWPAAPSMPDLLSGSVGTDGQPLLQPAVPHSWGDLGAQAAPSPAPILGDPVPPSLMLAALQAPNGRHPADSAPPAAMRRNGAQPPTRGVEAAPGRPSAPAGLPGRQAHPLMSQPGNMARRQTSELGTLAAERETSGRGPNPGLVSTGVGDRGGISYGTYQLATRTGTAREFAASPEVRRYAPELARLAPGQPQFAAEWRRIAARDPIGFQALQHAFMQRTHYEPAVRRVAQSTGLDLQARSDAVRELAWSVADQFHNAAPGIISRAIGSADRSLHRDDARYDAALIDAINDARSAPHISRRDGLLDRAQRANPAARARLRAAAHHEDNLIHGWERERQRAHQILNGH